MSEMRDVWYGPARNDDRAPRTKAEAHGEWVRFWIHEDRGLPPEHLGASHLATAPLWYSRYAPWRTGNYLLECVKETDSTWPSRQERAAIQYRDAGYAQRAIAAGLGLSRSRVSQLLRRAVWKLELLGAPGAWLSGEWPHWREPPQT